jgi:hypothetical protein
VHNGTRARARGFNRSRTNPLAAELVFRQPGKALALGVRERAGLPAAFTSACASRRSRSEILFAALRGLRTRTTDSFRPSGAAVAYTVGATSVSGIDALHLTVRASIERSGAKDGKKEKNGGGEFHSSLAPYAMQ